ncbi:MAG TPA: Fic family protein [Candidatus Bathyarchaeia archaeon]|nr:Fic family protein [Candidatus Bathyarchaeia archaeon]
MRIIKRRKGNSEYFYLQHSFRKDGKVVTKELYLGKEIPSNVEELKGRLAHRAHEVLYEKLEEIRSDFQKEWRRIPRSAKEKELHEIAIAFTYNTNAIEGSTITLEEARLILEDKVAPSKPIRDIRETESHAAVFLQMLRTNENLSNKLLLKWHGDIFRETKPDIAGQYRTFPVRVGPYIAPDWQKVKKLMSQLVAFMNESNLNPVEVAARAHYMFEKTHPFGDGNGRVGRLLMNYALWRKGYPMLIIEYKKRKSYYKALERTEEGFANYFIRRYISVHQKRLQ